MDLLASTQPAIKKTNFDDFWKNLKKHSAVKHHTETPILVTFVNVSTTFVQDCSFDLLLRIKLFKLRPEVKIGTQGSFTVF